MRNIKAEQSPSGKALVAYERLCRETGGKSSPFFDSKKMATLLRLYRNKLILFSV